MGIKMKRSSVAGKVPVTTDLELGELAMNTYDGKLYLRKNAAPDAQALFLLRNPDPVTPDVPLIPETAH